MPNRDLFPHGPRLSTCSCVITIAFVLAIVVASKADAAESPQSVSRDIQQFSIAARQFFADLGLVAILTDRGQDVGYVYEPDGLTLIDKGNFCFPTLHRPSYQPAGLLSFKNISGLELGAALGLHDVADIQAAGKFGRLVEIFYEDVQMRAVSAKELQHAFSPKNCRELSDVLSGKFSPVKGAERPLLVIGEVYVGKPRLVVEMDRSADVAANANGLTQVLKKLHLNITAKASVDGGSTNRVALTSLNAVPIAVRPAFVPRYFPDVPMGTGEGAIDPDHVQWEIFDPTNTPSQGALLRKYFVPATQQK